MLVVSCQYVSCVGPFATPWTIAHQGPLSMEFSRQEYWSGLPFPSPTAAVGNEYADCSLRLQKLPEDKLR